MIINHNISAVNAHRILKFSDWEADISLQKLASGMKINRSSDDASGLAISEKMRAQVMGLRQAEQNTEGGISFVQTADGYLNQAANLLQRVRVLALQAANGIYTNEDRQLMQLEVSQLIDEVDRIASQAEFNRLNLLQGDLARGSQTSSLWFHMGPNMHQRERIYVGTMTADALRLRDISGQVVSISNMSKANHLIGLLDEGLTTLMKQRAYLGAYSDRFESAARELMNAYENAQAAESRIRDVDMAEEMTEFMKKKILSQSGTAMLAQANMKPDLILRLLG